MIFTVHGEHPDGDHSEFVRITAAGAVFKAADLMGLATGVHISIRTSRYFGPTPSISSSVCGNRTPSGPRAVKRAGRPRSRQ